MKFSEGEFKFTIRNATEKKRYTMLLVHRYLPVRRTRYDILVLSSDWLLHKHINFNLKINNLL